MKKIYIVLLAVICVLNLNAQPLDRSKRPEAKTAPEINFGKYEKFTLKNGLKVFIVESKRLPLVTITLDLENSAVLQKDKAGFTEATGELLSTGTKTRTKDQLNEEIDFLGSKFSASDDAVAISGLSKNFEKMLNIFSDVVKNSDFKKEELDKITKRMIADIQSSNDDPKAIARRVAKKVFYGENHPYSESPTEKTLANVSLDDCINYYKTYFVPNNGYLAIIGDISRKEVEPLLNKYLGDWKQGKLPKQNFPKPAQPKKNIVAFVDREGAVQSTLRVGYPLYLLEGKKETIISKLTNTVLGGGVFRLYDNLREKHSYTYGAYSSLVTRDKLVGSWTASADVKSSVTDSSVYQIIYEMNKIRNEKVPVSELQRAKNYITGSFARSLEEPETMAEYVMNIAKFNLQNDYYKNYLKIINTASDVEVQKAAKEIIKPENAFIVVVGDAKTNAKKMEKFGTVEFYDVYGNKVVKSDKAEITKDVTTDKIFKAYIDAIGGDAKIKEIKDVKMEGSADIQGPQGKMKLELVNYKKEPNKLKVEIKVMGMTQTIVFDGEKGYMASPMGKKDFEPAQVEEYTYDSKINPYAELDKLGIKVELDGTAKVGENDAYKVVFTNKSGKKWSEYFDIPTGLKVKESKTEDTPQGSVTSITEFQDYKEVNGVKIPHTLKQSVMGQIMEFKMSKIEVNTNLSDELFK